MVGQYENLQNIAVFTLIPLPIGDTRYYPRWNKCRRALLYPVSMKQTKPSFRFHIPGIIQTEASGSRGASKYRGKSVHTRGISKEQVCVVCAIDCEGHSIARIADLGRLETSSLGDVLNNRIAEGSYPCTDGLSSYRKFAENNKLKLEAIRGGRTKRGIYNVQRINQYYSRPKRFMATFNGVATKHLNRHLVWHNFVNYAKNTPEEKEAILKSSSLSCRYDLRCKDISNLKVILRHLSLC